MVFHVYMPANVLLTDDMYLCKNVERGRVKWIFSCLNTNAERGLKQQNAHKDVTPYCKMGHMEHQTQNSNQNHHKATISLRKV